MPETSFNPLLAPAGLSILLMQRRRDSYFVYFYLPPTGSDEVLPTWVTVAAYTPFAL